MRRLIVVALFLTFAAALPSAAQRSGGRASGRAGSGGHAMSGGHSGFSGHSGFGGAHSGAGFGVHALPRGSSPGRSPQGRSFQGRSQGRSSASGVARSPRPQRGFNRNGLRLRTYGLRNNCYGYRCGYGYRYPWGYGGFDPYWWWNSGSSYDQDQQDQIGLANEMNQQSLDEQRMRREDEQDFSANSAPAMPHREERTEAAPATVLVFRDQQRREVQNYAIVGQTLWNFAPQRTEKIPLSELDVAATVKANDDRGVSFRLPGGDAGQ